MFLSLFSLLLMSITSALNTALCRLYYRKFSFYLVSRGSGAILRLVNNTLNLNANDLHYVKKSVILSSIAVDQERIVTKAKLHTDLVEQTLIALSEPIREPILHSDVEVYARFKVCIALALLKESLGEGTEKVQTNIQSAT